MAQLLVLTCAPGTGGPVLPVLDLLAHQVRVLPLEPVALLDAPPADAIIVDARQDLHAARGICRILRSTGTSAPVLVVLTDSGLAAVAADWGMDEVLTDAAGPAEWAARLRLAAARRAEPATPERAAGTVGVAGLTVDDVTYTARLHGRALDLTFKEFELLKFLAQHPGRVFTRGQLLQEVWGYDYYGGTRTVDVHVRRLRAKLGAEHESLIGTVRNVGYKFAAAGVAPAEAATVADVGG